MKATDLNEAMLYIDDRFLDLADDPQKEIIQMSNRKYKTMLRFYAIAAILALLSITAYAADFLNIKTLTTGSSSSFSSYSQVKAAMRQAGFQMDIRESFDSGYTFELIRVQDTDALDENDHKVLSYKELAVHYRNADGTRLVLWAMPDLEEVPHTQHAEGVSREISGITVTYWQDHYKLVPEDYQPTEEDQAWMEQPGNFLTYGSEEVEEQTPGFLGWEKDGIRYSIMDIRGKVPAEILFDMAEALICRP